jgi:hypothetical protein
MMGNKLKWMCMSIKEKVELVWVCIIPIKV